MQPAAGMATGQPPYPKSRKREGEGAGQGRGKRKNAGASPKKRGCRIFFAILYLKNAVRNRKTFKNRVKGFLESIAVFRKKHLNPVQWESGRKRRICGNPRAFGETVYFIPFLYFILSVPGKPYPPAALRQKTLKDKLVGRSRKDAASAGTSLLRKRMQSRRGGKKKGRNRKKEREHNWQMKKKMETERWEAKRQSKET